MEEQEIKTLQEAILYFSDSDNCREYMVARRWPNGVTCPRCDSDKVAYQSKYNRWQCSSHHPRRQFTIKTGTIFEDSPLPMQKWLPAVWFVVNCKNGISSYEIHRALGVTQKTAWFMLQRIRLAMQASPFVQSMSGQIEVDETFIGGKARNMHKGAREARIKARGPLGKTIVMGLLSRHGEVRTQVVASSNRKTLHGIIKENVSSRAEVFTDAHPAYFGLDSEYAHQVIDHAEAYVKGNVHTNGLENFWSLLKRGINGTYISVEPFHLFRYVDEQVFCYNNRRKMNDGDRFRKGGAGGRQAGHLQGTHRQGGRNGSLN